MKNEARKSFVAKICSKCEMQATCPRSTAMARKCYQQWYNSTQRDPEDEKLRQARFRRRNFAQNMLHRCRSQAKKAGMAFDLDVEWFKTELSKGICAATDLPFEMPIYQRGARGKRSPWTPSVDRIDNSKGYVKGNCRLVVWVFNLAKSNYAESDISRMCQALVAKERAIEMGIHQHQVTVTKLVKQAGVLFPPTCNGIGKSSKCCS